MSGKKLLYGVEYDGRLHYDFEIRVPVMADVYTALDETEKKCGSPDTATGDMYYRMALMAGVLRKLGDIPAESVTAELLRDNLLMEDYDLLNAAISELKKKRLRTNGDAKGCDLPSSPSASTGSAKSG